MAKTSRCWPGYEPVPGKKPHSQGSCRKKAASKSSASEKRFQTRRKKQLARWKKGHPRTRKSAAQHLHAPGAKTKRARRSPTARRRTTTRRRTAARR